MCMFDYCSFPFRIESQTGFYLGFHLAVNIDKFLQMEVSKSSRKFVAVTATQAVYMSVARIVART